MSEATRGQIHRGLSVQVAGSDDIGIVVAQQGERFEVQTEHGRSWYPAQELRPAPIPVRLLQMAVETLQELAARHWSAARAEEQTPMEQIDETLRDQIAHHDYDSIEARPLGYDQLWIESEPEDEQSEQR